MGFKCGIVGLPNVGKSTLFNALTATQSAESANYPFCTIEPNVGKVGVPDARLAKVAAITTSAKIINAQMEFVDIAGLVKGASEGEGLGNKFLSHIREVDAIVHVIRCFEDDNITHVHGKIDPINDIEVIETELILSDLESVTRRITNISKKAKGGDKEAKEELDALEAVKPVLDSGKWISTMKTDGESWKAICKLNLLTSKPVLYVCNVEEDSAATGNSLSEKVFAKAKAEGNQAVIISSRIEEEISLLESEEEKSEFLSTIGLKETGLARIIRAGYDLLGLQSYFTAGPKEARAWTFHKGIKAPEAAGIIHTDFEKGFIRAEVISYEDFIACNGEAKAKELGKMRLEGKEYVMQDGDVVHFRFNV